jgi:hypothetical protein
MPNRSLTDLVDEQLGFTPRQPAAETSPTRQTSTSPATQQVTSWADEAEKVAQVLDYVVSSNTLEKLAGGGRPLPDTNENEAKPKGTVNTLASQRRTSHPAFASHASVAKATKGDVARENTPALRQAFDATPYADPVTGMILSTKVDHRDVNARLAAARSAKAKRQGGRR